MNRRHAMTLLPAALLAPRMGHARGGRRVIVIGAGIAGLAAARDLQAAGWQVTVVEARDRIGGRIHTSRLWPDLPMDLGASWIHGTTGNPLTDLADTIGAARVETSYDRSITLGPDGASMDLGPEMKTAAIAVSIAREDTFEALVDVSLAEAVMASAAWKDGNDTDRRLIRHYINATVEQEYGCDWADASAWHFDDGRAFAGPDVLFPGGYDQIPAHLAQGLSLRLGQPVTALAPGGPGVSVTLADGSVLTADHAIVTLPLGVLQSGAVRLAEPLSAARTSAIDGLQMGLLNKCWLRFDKVAWPDDVDWIEWLGPKDGYWSQWVSLANATGAPVLSAFNAGSQAREVEALDDAGTISAAHDALRSMFGSRFPAPVDAQITRWSKDPFALGSYSFRATGSASTLSHPRYDLSGADWDNRLIFAGEAANHHYPGTVHGAYLSGQSAARQLIGLAP
jgi:monoamine oxidase